VDPDDQDLLVIGAIEDADVPVGWQLLGIPPQIVVIELGRRRDLERMDLDALRIDPAHDVADRPVLAGRIHRLQDDEEALVVLGGEAALVLGEHLDAGLQEALRLVALDLAVRTRVEIAAQPDLRAGLDPEWLDERCDPLRPDPRHRDPSVAGRGATARCNPRWEGKPTTRVGLAAG
jgi:hypothetical protein